MRSFKNVLVMAMAGVVCVLAMRGAGILGAAKVPDPSAARESTTKLATCDAFGLVQAMIETEPYFVPRKQTEQKLKEPLAPLQAAIDEIKTQLQGADPNNATNQAKAREGQLKYDEYKKLAKEAQDQYAAFVAAQLVDAYGKVQSSAQAIAKGRGYSHVLLQRSGKIQSVADAQKLAEEFLSRPMLMQPDGSDITEAVRMDLKLPEKASNENSLLAPSGDLKPGETKSAEKK